MRPGGGRAAGLAAALVVAWAASSLHAAPAAGRPDLRGVWRLDVAGSTWGRGIGTAPDARVDSVSQRGAEVRVVSRIRRGDEIERLAYRYLTDAREHTETVSGQKVTSRARWSGDTLRVDTRARVLLIEVRVHERWRLAAGGDTLVIARESESPLGRQRQRLVFGRAAAPE